MRRSAGGFTLVELIIVVAILGVIAAIAIPKYIELTKEARIAALNSLAGSVRSAVAIVQGNYKSRGNFTATTVTLNDGSVIQVNAARGFPTAKAAAGTNKNISDIVDANGFKYDAVSARFNFSSKAVTDCYVSYDSTTGKVTVIDTGC